MQNKKAHVVAVDMGYGHQRAVFPLRHLAGGEIINANRYAGIPKADERRWESGRRIYETISRFKHVPLIGELAFEIMDYIQRIEPFYPVRDLSATTWQVNQIYGMIKKGWGKDLIDGLNKNPLPFITSFFTSAFFAEEHKYQGEIFLICCDTDVARAWAPLKPKESRIKYLVPNRRVHERIKSYGIKPENIFVTGFPLPQENIGGKSLKILKKSIGERVCHLDPRGKYQKKFHETLIEFLGKDYINCKESNGHPITITFAVGGAGAQRELGVEILESLKEKILNNQVKLNLVAGVRNEVYLYYQAAMRSLNLEGKCNGNVNILYADNKNDYFAKFNELLLTTDVLWTKPSELSFYAGLGLPIIMAPSVGSQEDFNREWLLSIGAGVDQDDPRYTHEWFFDWLESGWLAQASMQGFLNAPRNGVLHIEEVVLEGKRSEIEDIHLL